MKDLISDLKTLGPAFKDLFKTFKVFVSISSFIYAIAFSFVLLSEGKKDIQGLTKFVYKNDLHIILISISIILYIVYLIFIHSNIIFDMAKIKKNKSNLIAFIVTILLLILLPWVIYGLTRIIFSVLYGYSTKKLHFLFYVLYYATFTGFLFVIRDLLDAFKGKNTIAKHFFNFRYLLYVLVFIASTLLAVWLDKSVYERSVAEAVFTGISSVLLILTISISFLLSFLRQ